ncbi:hypothetical protein [Notoacmeibacter sp. MSK16QG-6]|nr:hypothetical protein [Notoacmeibacter sp. MSK16QG-6]
MAERTAKTERAEVQATVMDSARRAVDDKRRAPKTPASEWNVNALGVS